MLATVQTIAPMQPPFRRRQPFNWGSIFASATGSRTLFREQQAADGAPILDQLANNFSKLSLSTTVGIEVGGLTATATRNFSGGYTITNVANQTAVGSFAPVNLSVRYDLGDTGRFTRGLSFSLNVDNVGNIQPPFVNASGGTANGSTLGRYVSFGIQKTF